MYDVFDVLSKILNVDSLWLLDVLPFGDGV